MLASGRMAHVTICVITPRVSKGRLGAGHGVASQFADMEKLAEARGWDGHLPPERQRHRRDPQGSRSQGQAPARLWEALRLVEAHLVDVVLCWRWGRAS
jgi:hypothetical protein